MGKINVLKQRWADHNRYILIAGKNKGSLQMDVYDDEQDFGGRVCLYALYVTPEYRGEGVAKALLKEAETIAFNEGCDDVILDFDTKDSSEFVYEMYLKLGYKPQFITFKKTIRDNYV